MEPAILLRGVTKRFERKPERGLRGWLRRGPREHTEALAGVDLEVRPGELFGLLGPNGAGKTTLVKVMATLLLPDAGEVRVGGLDAVRQADAVRRMVGVVLGGERALYWRLTGRENLWYFSQLYDMPDARAKARIQELLDLVGLADRADERVENYSKGMKQRLHIARGLLHDPRILLLDEPTIGLDPQAARTLRSLVRDLATRHGRTVVLTTHYMYEADALSDRVAVLHRGRVVACDAPAALKARHAGGLAYRVAVRNGGSGGGAGAGGSAGGAGRAGGAGGDPGGLARVLGGVPGVEHVGPPDRSPDGTLTYRVAARGAGLDAGALAQAVAKGGAELLALARDEPSLEDVFVRLTGERLDARGEAERA